MDFLNALWPFSWQLILEKNILAWWQLISAFQLSRLWTLNAPFLASPLRLIYLHKNCWGFQRTIEAQAKHHEKPPNTGHFHHWNSRVLLGSRQRSQLQGSSQSETGQPQSSWSWLARPNHAPRMCGQPFGKVLGTSQPCAIRAIAASSQGSQQRHNWGQARRYLSVPGRGTWGLWSYWRDQLAQEYVDRFHDDWKRDN